MRTLLDVERALYAWPLASASTMSSIKSCWLECHQSSLRGPDPRNEKGSLVGLANPSGELSHPTRGTPRKRRSRFQRVRRQWTTKMRIGERVMLAPCIALFYTVSGFCVPYVLYSFCATIVFECYAILAHWKRYYREGRWRKGVVECVSPRVRVPQISTHVASSD